MTYLMCVKKSIFKFMQMMHKSLHWQKTTTKPPQLLHLQCPMFRTGLLNIVTPKKLCV